MHLLIRIGRFRNSYLEAVYDDPENILAATIEVDDHVDFESLRVEIKHPPFPTQGYIRSFQSRIISDPMMKAVWQPLIPTLPSALSLNGWNQPLAWLSLFVVLILSVTIFSNSQASRLVQSWPLRHLGLLSYSLYLFHVPVMMYLRQNHQLSGGYLFITTFLITYVIALMSYVVVERPFLMLKPASKKSL